MARQFDAVIHIDRTTAVHAARCRAAAGIRRSRRKLAALSTDSGVARLGIPSFGSTEGIHGIVRRADEKKGRAAINTTQFPQPPGMGASWDPDLVRQAATVQSTEARYITQSSQYKHPMLMQWGPQADLARDPRWGRSEEVYGEDAFLVGSMAVAFTRGTSGRRPEVLARRRAAEALSGQQQRERSRQLDVRFRRAPVPRILFGPLPHGLRTGRRARP
jgi:beta-glucosidase-like glycosyl hydrolase